MTESTRPPDQGWSADEPAAAPPAAPPSSHATSSTSTAVAEPAGRPGTVTAASVTLIVLGALTILFGVLILLGSALFAGGGDAVDTPGLGGMLGAFAGMLIFIGILVLLFGGLQIWAGINALGGKSWARTTGIVLSVIGAAMFVGGIFSAGEGANPILNIVFVAAYLFVVFALVTGGRWFGRAT